MEERAGPHCIGSLEKETTAESKSSFRIFWGILAIILICGILGTTVASVLSFAHSSSKVVRLNFQNHPGSQLNQSAFVDKSHNAVTYYVTSPSNRTTAVLFDGKNNYVCYKPAEQNHCYLRAMDARDQDTIQMSFNLSEHKLDQLLLPNERTKYYREFLGIVPGRQMWPEEMGESIQSLCDQLPIYWVKKKDGPAKQRLIYLCIDICFPNNICVSICFYYLPE